VNFPLSDTTIEELTDDPRIEAQTVARVCHASVGGQGVEVLAVRPGGTAPPVLGSGRLPASASEIALGARLGHGLDARVGDIVRFSAAGGDCATNEPMELDLTVVGVAVPPVLGGRDIGQGAVVTLDAIVAAGGDDHPQFVLARFSGDDPGAVGASLDRDLTEEILTDSIPAEVANLHRVRGLPLIGLLLAGAMGTIVLAYTLANDQRGQMRDYAVMRTLGLAAPQLRRVMAWQGVVLAGMMVLVGLPVGVVVGRAVWRRSADGLGVGAGPITPWLLLLIPLSGAVAIIATLHPARRARRTSVAKLLRVE
jgi:putative ABC transport system permease protein